MQNKLKNLKPQKNSQKKTDFQLIMNIVQPAK
jgi:hypothetical protein